MRFAFGICKRLNYWVNFDLPAQPGSISLSANGSTMGVVYPNAGVSLWSVANPQQPMLEEFGTGQLAIGVFSFR